MRYNRDDKTELVKHMVKTSERIDWGLFFITLLLGWFGLDKFYVRRTWSPTWKFWLVKLGYNLIFVGALWNLWDLVMILLCRYQFDAREYFA